MEQWDKWKPIDQLAGSYYIDSISDDINGLKILLSEEIDEKKKVLVLFEDGVISYRSTNESFRLTTLRKLDQKYEKELYVDWTFFKVSHSSYLKWISEESHVATYTPTLQQITIFSLDSVLDIITAHEPIVKLLTTE